MSFTRWLAATTSATMVAAAGAVSVVAVAGLVATATPAAAAVPSAPYTVNINNREDVRQFYNLVHEAASTVPDGWNGNVATCDPGTPSADYLAATLSRINWFRTMAGEPDVTFTPALNTEAQANALIMSANGKLNHNPPSTGTGSLCFTALGAAGAAASNLAIGNEGPAAIDQNIDDHFNPAPPNGGGALGHRRNSLDPTITTEGSGSIPANNGHAAVESNIVLTTPLGTRPPVRDGFVAWPPAGFVPYQTVYPRWSFALPGADFSGASVSMQHNGSAFPVLLRCVDPNVSADPLCGQFGEPAVSWSVNGLADGSGWPQPPADDPYVVTISGVKVNGVALAPFTYTVTVIDPAVSDVAHTATQAPTGPVSPLVSSGPTYSTSPITDATGYQWRTTPVAPGDLFDGAENGMTNFTANVSGYNPISTAKASSGISSFRMVGYGAANPPTDQTITMNQTVLASATSSLSYDSLYWSNLNESAQVQVSLDSGVTWTPAFSQAPPSSEQDATFTTKTVSLAAYAGHQIQLRFDLTFTGGNYALDFGGEPNGWYVDNVALSHVQQSGTPVLSAVRASPTFVLANPAQASVSIDVRPQFSNATFGSSLGGWSPALVVTSVGSVGVTTLTSSANPATANNPVTYTASVAPNDGGGTVSFTDNGTAISGCQSLALTAGHATCSQTYAFTAAHSIVATYSGDAGFAGSSSTALNQAVNAPTATTGSLVTSSTNVQGGTPVTFTATASPTDGGGTVSFSDNGNAIAGCGAVQLNAAGQALCTMVSAGPEHSLIEADYSGDANFLGGPLGNLLQSVTAFTSTSISSSANPAAPGTAVTYTVHVTPATGFGTVSVIDNGQPIPACVGANTLDSTGTMTCTVTWDTAGPHEVQALYSGWNGLGPFAPSASPVLSQAVGTLAATSTAVVSSANPSSVGQAVTFTATVTGSDGGGTVSFTDRGNAISGCQSLTPSAAGVTTCVQTVTDTQPRLIAAYFSGDAADAGSTSAAVNQVVTAAAPNAAPTAAAANLGNGAANVGFTAPAPAATFGAGAVPLTTPISNVTGFNVYQGTSAGHESTTPVNPSRIFATRTGYTVGGLTVGTTYYFKVRALNAAGLSAPSAEVSVKATSAPTAPLTLAAASHKEYVALTWKPPASNGSSAVTRYDVYMGTVGGRESATPVNPVAIAGTAASYKVMGLTDGIQYYFTLRARTAVAGSPASNEASATPANVPGAPVGLAAYASNGSLRIRWAASDVSGGSALTGFNVYRGTVTGQESATPVNASPLAASTTTFTVPGLTNGTTYYVTVKAINPVGTSLPSKQSSATPAVLTPPAWPQTLTAVAGVASVKLAWTAASSSGGSAVTGYNVYAGTVSGGESSTPLNASPLAATVTTYTATGLSNGRTYFFTVKAINAIGLGAPSVEVTGAPAAAATVPGAVSQLTAAAGNAKITLTWAAPTWNGGSPITGYNVYLGTVAGRESATPVNATPLAATTSTFAITGLTNSTQYYVTVRAINAVGTGSAREASARPSAT